MKPLLLSAFLAVAATAAVSVPITVRETLYSGSVTGVARTDEPVTAGIPLPDSANITNTGALGVTGATAAQFMVEGKWPSGNIKWVKVRAVVPSVSAGGTATIVLTDSGVGNFGGANLATDNGGTITVSTGSATFTINKANFNVVDKVVIGSTTVVASGTAQGLVLVGPDPTAAYPGNVTCLPATGGTACATVYASANDANSTAVIEENGPAMAVIKATGRHLDGSGHAYMNFTARLYFYKNKNYIKVTSILRNADYGSSNTFATAYKGFQGYELRISPNITGTLNYAIANHTGTSTGTLASASDSAYLYQAESTLMTNNGNWCNGSACVPYTTLSGYSIVKNGAAVLTGNSSQYPTGWADISNSAGAGVEIGQYQLAAYGNKSLEFNSGGSDVRIGIWARENNTTSTSSTTANAPYYMSWPQWSINDVYLNFHASALASPANDFLKFQHYLVASASAAYYNSCNVFLYPLLDTTEEDSYYSSVVASASPAVSAPSIKDLGITDTYNWPLNAWRFYPWASGGVSNQMEFRLARLFNFIRRGFTGSYLDSAHFYKFIVEKAFPMSDGFDWRTSPPNDTQYVGFPVATSANNGKSMRDWVEPGQEHSHWYGMPDYYFMSGDETIHDGIIEGPKDAFMNTVGTAGGTSNLMTAGWFWNARAVGVALMSASRLSEFLKATGDPDYPTLLANGQNVYDKQIAPDFCAYAGFPTGCTPDPYNNLGGYAVRQRGVSRVRGVPYEWGDTIEQTGCPTNPQDVRDQAPFMVGILLQGLWEFRQTMGPGWANYNQAFDLGYGVAQWAFGEMYVDNGTSSWTGNGFRYKQAIDFQNSCNVGAGGAPSGYDWMVQNPNAFWPIFFFRSQYEGSANSATIKRQFNQSLQQVISGGSSIKDELFHYTIGEVIYALNHPSGLSLNTVPITNFVDNGSGSYTITWTVPAGASSYRIKWSPKQIVDWIGFDSGNYTFIGNPATTMNWFAATDAANIPAPSGPTQSLTIATGVPGLTAANFMIKAYAGGTTGGPTQDTTPPTAAITAPAGGASVSGTSVTLSATASDNVAVASLQFTLDGATLGSTIAAPGPYTATWNTTAVANGSHVLSAVATDTSGNKGSSAPVTVTVSNSTGPVISNLAVNSVSSSSAAISWTTNGNADTQVAYGVTAAYGQLSALVSNLTTAHAVTLSGLSASTTYHYQVMSRDSQGNLTSSSDFTFTTSTVTTSGGTAVPTGAWTSIKAGGMTGVETMGYEKSVFVNSKKISCFLGSYKQFTTSEANNAIVCYSYSENRWVVLQNSSYWHSSYAGEAGHSHRGFAYDSDRDAIYYVSDGSGSSQPADGFFGHFWMYDIGGLNGRDKQVSAMQWMGANGAISAFAYDSYDQKTLSWNSSKTLSVYDPVTNTMFTPTASGPIPNPSDVSVNLVYNPDNHKTYAYGGFMAGLYTVQCATQACSSVVWTQLTTTCSGTACSGPNPPVRMRSAMAYSTTDHVFLMCAGMTGAGAGFTDSWIFDPSNNSWTQQTPATTYTNTGNYTTPYDKLTYDNDSNVFVLVTNPTGYSASISVFPYSQAANYGRNAVSSSLPTGMLNRYTAGASQSWAFDPAITTANGMVYAGWIETGADSDNSACGAGHHPMVQASSSTGTWTQYGGCTSIAPELSGSTDSSKLRLASVSGALWEAHEESNGPGGYTSSAYARYWNGSAWIGGQVGCFTGSCAVGSNGKVRQYPAALVSNGGVPTLAVVEADNGTYSEEQYLYVAQYASGAWSKMGSTFLNVNGVGSGTRAVSASMTTDGTNPAVCWAEEKIDPSSRATVLSPPQIRCSQWNGSQWNAFGTAAINKSTSNWAYDPTITYAGGSFYIAWVERTTAGNTQLYACKWTGTGCTSLGGGPLNVNTSTGWAVHPSLATDGTTVYLAWEEQAALNQHSLGYVSTWNGTSWAQVGGALAADAANGSLQGISLTVVGGAPIAVWAELSFGNLRQIFGKQWNGTDWQSINGLISTPPPSTSATSACDLNSDGVVDSKDYQLAIDQALGVLPCTNAALLNNGQCNVVGVQRVVNATLSGVCSTKP
jgi:hypothetical protein